MDFQKTSEATGNFIRNKIVDKIAKNLNRIIRKQLQMKMIKK